MGCICPKQLNLNLEIPINQNDNINSFTKYININESSNDNFYLSEETKPKIKKYNSDDFQKLIEFKEKLNLSEIESKLKQLTQTNFNYPELEDVEVGEGYKKIKGYISKISLYELEEVRKEFWENKKEGNENIWKELKYICETENIKDTKIKEIFISFNFIALYNSINICIDIKKNIYEIPNYCIQNPSEYDLKMDSYSDKPNLTEINIKLLYLNKFFEIKMNNLDTILDFKAEILNMEEFKQLEDNSISLFLNDIELEDEKEIWMYNINEDSIIKLIIRNVV